MNSEAAYTSVLDLVFSFFASAALLTVTFAALPTEGVELQNDFVMLHIRWSENDETNVVLHNSSSGEPKDWTFSPRNAGAGRNANESVYFLAPLPTGEWDVTIPIGVESFHLITRSMDQEFRRRGYTHRITGTGYMNSSN